MKYSFCLFVRLTDYQDKLERCGCLACSFWRSGEKNHSPNSSVLGEGLTVCCLISVCLFSKTRIICVPILQQNQTKTGSMRWTLRWLRSPLSTVESNKEHFHPESVQLESFLLPLAVCLVKLWPVSTHPRVAEAEHRAGSRSAFCPSRLKDFSLLSVLHWTLLLYCRDSVDLQLLQHHILQTLMPLLSSSLQNNLLYHFLSNSWTLFEYNWHQVTLQFLCQILKTQHHLTFSVLKGW